MRPGSSKKPKKEYLALASRVAALRVEHGFTQYDAAAFLNIHQSAYQRKEAGIHHFKIEELVLLAGLFQIPFWEFLWNESNKTSFERFARQKGYMPAEYVSKKFEKLESAMVEKEEIIMELRKDKEFLQSRINALHHEMRVGGGKSDF